MAFAHVEDGYTARSGRDYKGKHRYEAWWGGSMNFYGQPYIYTPDWGVIDIEGETNEKLIVWEFVIEIWRTYTFVIPGDITFEFRDGDDPIFDGPGGVNDHAAVTTAAVIYLNRSIFPGGDRYEGMPFVWQIMAHELGHAFLANAPAGTIEDFVALFPGATMADWDTGVWATSLQETFAELWAATSLHYKNRRDTNRTIHTLPLEAWTAPFPGGGPWGTPVPDQFPGPETFAHGEVWTVVNAMNGPLFGAGARYNPRDLYFNGPFRLAPHPWQYPYPVAGGTPVASQVATGVARSGMVTR
jgi:hypothetical protein